ncbi:hypothetical protein MTR_4g059830 [Medicago truncatula]|uniref:Uncharacterized protein n=1 Tax=Medicago truncatula TaxID=3880 RepID=G7JPF8_MEDTR|nr:hypothetical protein MTR_4g059830 [Medicago truncatula]
MDRPPTRYQDPRTNNPLNKAAGIIVFSSQNWRGRNPEDLKPADLNRPGTSESQAQEHKINGLNQQQRQDQRRKPPTSQPKQNKRRRRCHQLTTAAAPSTKQTESYLWCYTNKHYRNNQVIGGEDRPKQNKRRSESRTTSKANAAAQKEPEEA